MESEGRYDWIWASGGGGIFDGGDLWRGGAANAEWRWCGE